MSAAPAAEVAAEVAASNLLMDGALMLGAALVFVTIFRKLGLGATLGYIVGGAIIGPNVLGFIREADSIMAVSEIGIALLLFLVGMELNPNRLWRLRKDIFGLGFMQVLVCGLALAALIHFALGFSLEASIAIGLARRGHKTAVIDFDVGLRNLDLIMGCERRVVYDFVNVVHGEATLKQALIKDKRFDNLYVLAASQTRDKDALTKEGVEKVLKDLAADGFDYIVCDSPAGIEKGAFLAMYFADKAVVVVNPEVSSVRDSDRIIGLLDSKTRKAEAGEAVPAHLLLTRYSPARVASGEMLSIGDVEEVLGLKAVGVIPESSDVLNASNKGEPVILEGESEAGQAYDDAVSRLLGEERPLRFTTLEKKGFFSKLFGG